MLQQIFRVSRMGRDRPNHFTHDCGSVAMDLCISALIIGLCCAIIEAQNTLEDVKFLKICHRSDPHLNECVYDSVQSLRPYLKDGIEKLNIPPCEPLRIPEIEIRQGGGPVSMGATFTDIDLVGVTNFELIGVKIDTKQDSIKLKLRFPKLEMDSQYMMIGKILMLPIVGNGQASGNYSDIDAKIDVKGERYLNSTTKEIHFAVVDVNVILNIGHASIRLENMFDGDETLTDAMNLFLNDNWKIVAGEIKPALEKSVADLIKDFSNKVYAQYSLDVLLPP